MLNDVRELLYNFFAAEGFWRSLLPSAIPPNCAAGRNL
jgi:hypothetical protein